jgi:hypothetical protein
MEHVDVNFFAIPLRSIQYNNLIKEANTNAWLAKSKLCHRRLQSWVRIPLKRLIRYRWVEVDFNSIANFHLKIKFFNGYIKNRTITTVMFLKLFYSAIEDNTRYIYNTIHKWTFRENGDKFQTETTGALRIER